METMTTCSALESIGTVRWLTSGSWGSALGRCGRWRRGKLGVENDSYKTPDLSFWWDMKSDVTTIVHTVIGV